jgi:hypothetical protein
LIEIVSGDRVPYRFVKKHRIELEERHALSAQKAVHNKVAEIPEIVERSHHQDTEVKNRSGHSVKE